jgi:radical SAM superfamily enzyme YgiQ (UPF0313 family)
MTNKYYIIYGPLVFNLIDQIGSCSTPLEMLSFITGLDASKINEKNFKNFLGFDLSKQRVGLIELYAIENCALIYIANQVAKIKPGTKVFPADGKRRTLEEIIESEGNKPEAVFITSISSNFPTAVATAIPLNHAKIPVIIGGIHVSTGPHDIDTFIRPYIPHPELVTQVRGAGDSTVMKQVLDDLKRGSIKSDYIGYETIEDGIWGQENVIHMEPLKVELLKKTPIIGSVLKNKNKFTINPITPYSGCHYFCNFCSISSLPKDQRRFKTRSPGDFIAELKDYQKSGVNAGNRIFFFLSDDLLFGGKTLEEILDKMLDSDLKINYGAQISIDVANRDDLLEKLRLSGAVRFLIGMESIDLRNLESIGKPIVKNIKKSGLSVKDYYAKQIKKIRDYGIAIIGTFMFGLPYDYFHSFEDNSAIEVVNFCLENHISLQPTALTDLPGSANFKESQAKGTLTYGQPGTMDYLLGLCLTDFSQSNRRIPDSLKNSPLIVSYMVYYSAQKVGSYLNTVKNGFLRAKQAWGYPTKIGRNSLRERAYDAFLAFGIQFLEGLYKEAYVEQAYSKNGVKGTFERLYDAEKNLEVREMFRDFIEQFR